jgi:hypothetical protein
MYSYSFVFDGPLQTDLIDMLNVDLVLLWMSKSASPRQRIKIQSHVRAVQGRRNTVHLWLSGQSPSLTMPFVSILYIHHIA